MLIYFADSMSAAGKLNPNNLPPFVIGCALSLPRYSEAMYIYKNVSCATLLRCVCVTLP